MKSFNFILALIAAIFLVSLAVPVVGAVSVSYGEWNGGSSSLTITQGQDAAFNYYFYTTLSSMHVSAKLYDSSGNLVYTFFDNQISSSYYYNNALVEITPQIYGNPGTYYLTFSSNDGSNSPSIQTIYLTVKPSYVPPINHAPVVQPIPNQTINESSQYSYQVQASDPDGDTLSYALGIINYIGPVWLSINPSTGLITGTAPYVSSNTNYQIEVQVSDGKNVTIRDYTITVKNVLPPNQDTTPPVIKIKSPSDNYATNSNSVTFKGLVSDNVAVEDVYLFINGMLQQQSSSGLNDTVYTFSTTLSDGNYSWYYEACDTSGNCAYSTQRNIVVDTVSPSVNFVSPTPSSGSTLDSTSIPINVTASDSGSGLEGIKVYLYDSSGNIVNSGTATHSPDAFNFTNLESGTYYIQATAYDNAGNSASTSRISVIINVSGQPGAARYNYYDVYPLYETQNKNVTQGTSSQAPASQKSNLGSTMWLAAMIILIGMIIIISAILVRETFMKSVPEKRENNPQVNQLY